MRRLIVIAAWAVVGCGDAPKTEPAPAEPQAAAVLPAPTPAQHGVELTIHSAAQLGAADLARVERLDLALSPVDQLGRLDEGDADTACEGLDLVVLSTQAPALRSLRISGCQSAVHEGLSRFGALEELELADLAIDGVTIGRLAELSGLQALTLSRVTYGEDSLAPLGAIRPKSLTLRSLDRDSGLARLLELWPATLKQAKLVGSWAGHAAMQRLSKAAALESLELADTRVGNFSLNQIKPLSHLREVIFRGNTVNNASPLYFRELPVERFVCACPRLGDNGLSSLKHTKTLRRVELVQSSVTSVGLPQLQRLRQLDHLVLADRPIDATTFGALSAIHNLRVLELSGELTDPRLTNLSTIEKLESLKLGCRALDDRGMAEIGKLKGLRVLDLGNTAISDVGLAALTELTHLRELKLHHTRITNRGLAHLSKLTSLELLELDHTDLIDAAIEHLAGLTNLRELRLDNTLVTDAALDHLLGLEKLERLNLANTVVTAEGAAKLAAMPALTTVGLEGTRAVH